MNKPIYIDCTPRIKTGSFERVPIDWNEVAKKLKEIENRPRVYYRIENDKRIQIS